jgi:hypothetical protein
MRIPSGKTDQAIYFVAKDDTGALLTGLTTFTVYRSRNGAAEVAFTTPTVTEIDTTNMPGVYALLVDEDTTIASGSDSEEMCFRITQASMEPVTRTIELYRRDTTTGRTLAVDSNSRVDVGLIEGADATDTINAQADLALADYDGPTHAELVSEINSVQTDVAGVNTLVLDLPTNAELAAALGTADDAVLAAIAALNNLSAAQVNAEVDTALADYDGPTHAELVSEINSVQSDIGGVNTLVLDLPTNAELTAALGTADDAVLAQVALVKAKTDNLPSDPADQSLIIAATDALATLIGDVPTNAELTAALAAADDAVLTAIDALPTANENRDALLAATVETGVTVLQSMRGFVSVMFAAHSKTSGVRTFRDINDTKDRIVATESSTARDTPSTLDLD